MAVIDETVRGYLLSADMDIDKTVERFCGSTDMLFRFLLKFPADGSFASAVSALECSDYDAFYSAVHTLKGVSGNLGLTNVYEKSVAVLEALKASDRALAVDLFAELKETYRQTLTQIEGIRAHIEG